MDNYSTIVQLDTDVLIIGGGAAGCFAAVEIKKRRPKRSCIIMEKAHIDRSGCLAMGLNAINAYLVPGQTPENFLEFVKREFMGIIREDLVYSIAQGLNEVVREVESWGLPIEKDEKGNYKARGARSIRIYGERLKPILAEAVARSSTTVLNRVVATNFIFDGERVGGAFGYGIRDGKLYVVRAKAVIVATGGTSGIYESNNQGSARHIMWYCPWNTGAGYAMGIRIGAEMTSFENRFVALRVKDVNAPTGTLAIGAGAKEFNALGEPYLETRYKHLGVYSCSTLHRLLANVEENKAGRGPCCLDTMHLSSEEEKKLMVDFLNMNPAIVLLWADKDSRPRRRPVEIGSTEPFLVGGHCEAGYWIDTQRRTTIKGLYAAGDVAGGAPKKYVSGCWVEARIAAGAALDDMVDVELLEIDSKDLQKEKERVFAPLKRTSKAEDSKSISPDEMRERLQKIMDEYAGGISTNYELNEERLLIARNLIERLRERGECLIARDSRELVKAHEVIDRIDVARVLIEHLLYRKETRWPGYQTRLDYPERDDVHWLKFVNSICDPITGNIMIVERPLSTVRSEEAGATQRVAPTLTS
ncbi:MAG: adenylyl-sulfate reductase subunit alpha [Candidatus Brocadiales bacterium]